MTVSESAEAIRALTQAQLVVAATGAGMSKESGIATFRDAQEGLWARYDSEELATREGFRANPARVWGWYSFRRGLISRVAPHAGHRALAELEKLVPQVVVVTQNIDGMHQRAGSTMVLELHGNIHRFKCFDNDHAVEIEVPLTENDGELEPPACVHCGSRIRPDVVWFGEMLPLGVFERAETLARSCDVMLVVGTSGLVQPAAGLPVSARAAGATVIEVNTLRSEITRHADIFLEGRAGVLLPELIDGVRTQRSR